MSQRVSMNSPVGAGTASVPAPQVERMKAQGWRLVETTKAPEAKKVPAKKAPARKSSAQSAEKTD